MNQEKVGKFISLSRKNKSLTQEQLAEKLSVSINAVSKWERGLNLPDVSLMKELCKILDITLYELFEGKKLTNEEIISKSEKNIMSLMMTLKQLKIVEIFIQILIGLGIALTISPGFILAKLNQKIIFIIIGLFIWTFGLFLKEKIRKTLYQLEKREMCMNKIKNSTEKEDFVMCPRCGKEVFKEAITCPFCKFGILAWLEKTIDENGNSVKKIKKIDSI